MWDFKKIYLSLAEASCTISHICNINVSSLACHVTCTLLQIDGNCILTGYSLSCGNFVSLFWKDVYLALLKKELTNANFGDVSACILQKGRGKKPHDYRLC